MTSLDSIRKEIDQGKPLEDVLSSLEWQDFEQLVSKIFEKHDYTVKTNFRFKTTRRWEMDILAIGNLISFGIDCKFWNSGMYKKSALKKAIEDQKERAENFDQFLKGNEVAKKMLKIKKRTTPLIITWFEEDLTEHDGVLIVPIWKLNRFLLTYSEYI